MSDFYCTAGDWKEKLLEVIDPEQLPVHWGGTQKGPDDDLFCSNKVIK